MKTRAILLLLGVLCVSAHPAFAQSRDPYFTTFSANYDVVYHEPYVTSNAGAHFDFASTWKRDVPFVGPVGEIGFNHFNGRTIASLMGGIRVRANTNYFVLPYVQFALGLYHCGACDVNDFALQGGAGVDLRTSSPAFRIRVQFDLRRVFDSVRGFNGERLSAGVVLPLNR